MRHKLGSLVLRKVPVCILCEKTGMARYVYCPLVSLVLDNQVRPANGRGVKLELEPLYFQTFPTPKETESISQSEEWLLDYYALPTNRYTTRGSLHKFQE